jgi:hypothetical protein
VHEQGGRGVAWQQASLGEYAHGHHDGGVPASRQRTGMNSLKSMAVRKQSPQTMMFARARTVQRSLPSALLSWCRRCTPLCSDTVAPSCCETLRTAQPIEPMHPCLASPPLQTSVCVSECACVRAYVCVINKLTESLKKEMFTAVMQWVTVMVVANVSCMRPCAGQ